MVSSTLMHSPQTPSRIAPHGAQRTSPHQIPLKCYSHVGKIHALPSPHLSTQPVISFKHPDSTFLASTVDHVLHSQTLPVPEDPTRSVPLENTPVDLPTSPTFQIPHFPSPSLLLPTMSFQAMQASMSVTSISSTVSTIGSPLVRDFEPDDLPDLCSVPELSLYSDTDSSVHPGSLESSPKREDFWDLDHAISSCCTTPATSFTPSPISASSQMSLIAPPSQDDYTVASSWQSVEDVGEMLSQLEKVACELRMMDSQEDTKNPSNVFPSFLGEERCLPHSAGDVYSSSDASQTHSLAYLQDDSSSFCCGEEDPVEEDSLHPDVPRIMITVPSTENLLESNDSSQDCEEFGRLLKGLKKSVVWLSPESARDISRLDSYSKREVSHTPRTSSLRLPPHAYSPPSQLLPFPCLPPIVISSLEPSNDSYVPPTPLPPETSPPENCLPSLPNVPLGKPEHPSPAIHPALWMCQLISEPIVHCSKKRLKDKRMTLSSSALRAPRKSSPPSPSPSLSLSEIKALLANSSLGDNTVEIPASASWAHVPQMSGRVQRQSLTTCWSEESLVTSSRKTSRWKVFRRIFKRKN